MMKHRAYVVAGIAPISGGAFFLLGFVLGWRFPTALIGGTLVMLAGTIFVSILSRVTEKRHQDDTGEGKEDSEQRHRRDRE